MAKPKRFVNDNGSDKPKHGFFFFFVLLVVAVILFLFGGKLYLYANFLLGNDIILNLNVDKSVLDLVRNQSENLVLDASIITNPFCVANCTLSLKDLSGNTVLIEEKFNLKTGSPFKKEYTITEQRFGEGQELYRFDLQCIGVKTNLCQSSDLYNYRSKLITVNYVLSDDDAKLKTQLKGYLDSFSDADIAFKEKGDYLSFLLARLKSYFAIDDIGLMQIQLNTKFKSFDSQLSDAKSVWEQQDYRALSSMMAPMTQLFSEISEQEAVLNRSVSDRIIAYNGAGQKLAAIKSNISYMINRDILNESLAIDLRDVSREYNDAVVSFALSNEVAQKSIAIDALYTKVVLLSARIDDDIKRTDLRNQISVMIGYDVMCNLTGDCRTHKTISELSGMTSFDVFSSCSGIDELRDLYDEINETLDGYPESSNSNVTYPLTTGFADFVALRSVNLKRAIAQRYISDMSLSAVNSGLLKELLGNTSFISESYTDANISEYNLTKALLKELIKNEPAACRILQLSDYNVSSLSNLTYSAIDYANISKSFDRANYPSRERISFDYALPSCCLFNRCDACCVNNCSSVEGSYPVILLHGHAFNKGISAEYSLDAFNQIQEKMELDGYVNAGAMTVYTMHEDKALWLKQTSPFTFKTSYYFDVFQQSDNYVIVQTKSENIDTYSIRLKDIIETVKYKTGKDKVIIVAHSMGGLVARRYIQLFGTSNIEELVLIAVPNKGIDASTISYCSFLGEQYECADLDSGSLFLNKLNREALPDIPIYNIVGSGCPMDSGDGDGVVLVNSSLLLERNNVKNFVVNGTCDGFDVLHTQMLNIYRYPEVYRLINESLRR